MHTEGILAPDSVEAAREAYETLGPAARTVVREVAREVATDRTAFEDLVTDEVVATARDAMFASLLEVRIGTHEEFVDWQAAFEGEVATTGSETVSSVVWHTAPASDRAVAATFEREEAAAVATLRRQAFGRLYRELL